MSEAIVKVESGGTGQLMRQATDVAGVCRELVTRTAMQLGGRRYVRLEGWQSIAVAYGCVASSRDVEKVPGGVRAIGEVRRMADGALVASAEGFVGEDEPTWYGGTLANGKTLPRRPDYAIRAMAQTRAISRACRSAFAFVVTLIDSNLSTTPYEEVPDGGFVDAVASPVAQRQDNLKAQLAASVALVNKHLGTSSSSTATYTASPQQPHAYPRASGAPVALPNYGKHKGEAISGADVATLEFYANGARRSLADESKAKWHAREQALLDALETELASRNAGDSQEPPPHIDEDAPGGAS